MGPKFILIKAEAVRAAATECKTKMGMDLIASEETEIALGGEVRVDKHGSQGARVGQNSHDDGAHAQMGHRRGFPEQCMMTVSSRSSFFWNLKVMEIVSERAKNGLLKWTVRLFRRNFRFPNRSRLVQ
jgi:hypothetical protein